MSNRESERSIGEAGRYVVANAGRPIGHEETLRRYLHAQAYVEERLRRRAAESARPTAPGDDTGRAHLVVVGVDGCAGSLAAVDQAAVEASLRSWPLRILHVARAVRTATVADDDRDLGTTLLSRMCERAQAQATNTPVSAELHVGPVIENLIRESATAGLLVVGSRGRGALVGLVAGSLSIEVAGHAVGPVMVVRAPLAAPSARTALPVVVAVDGSAAADAAAAFAAEEAGLRGVPLLALHVAPESPTHLDRRPDPLSTGALNPTSAVVAGITVRRRRTDGDVRETLIEASAEAAVIVIGARGVGSSHGVRLSSIGHALIRHAHCPVFVIHPATRGKSTAA